MVLWRPNKEVDEDEYKGKQQGGGKWDHEGELGKMTTIFLNREMS